MPAHWAGVYLRRSELSHTPSFFVLMQSFSPRGEVSQLYKDSPYSAEADEADFKTESMKKVIHKDIVKKKLKSLVESRYEDLGSFWRYCGNKWKNRAARNSSERTQSTKKIILGSKSLWPLGVGKCHVAWDGLTAEQQSRYELFKIISQLTHRSINARKKPCRPKDLKHNL